MKRGKFVLSCAALGGAVALAALGAGPAAAAAAPQVQQLACTSNSIKFNGSSGVLCFGGAVGSLKTDFAANQLYSGAYYGSAYCETPLGTGYQSFQPRQTIHWPDDYIVLSVQIAPPF
jgi:hypothetical protein